MSIDDYVYNGKFNRGDFEKRTIKSSIKEINDRTNIIVSFIKKKENGKVKNYEFTWMQKEKVNNDNHKKQNTNKRQSLNDKQTQMLIDSDW